MLFALNPEPYLQGESARKHACRGAAGSPNLAKADHLEVRREIGKLAVKFCQFPSFDPNTSGLPFF